MSARPEWMPSEGEVFMVRAVDNHDGGQEPSAEDIELICKITGLRAKIAALESLIEGQTGHMVDRAKKMIEEIRKELGA